MSQFGYTLFCEGFAPQELVAQAILAEEAGFDFLAISDHYHPWLTTQVHAGFTWSILGAIAQATSRIKLATMVTCPIIRYHPAVVAQMAATIAVLSSDRFTLGLGTGERLNEHVVGQGWPAVSERRAMLREAIEILKLLWEGDYVYYDGNYYTVEDARVFDLPEESIPLFVAAGGPASALLAAEIADGVCMTEPSTEIVDVYTSAEGNPLNIWGQVVTAWGKTEQAGLRMAHEQFRFAASGWKVQAELPNPVNFDAATTFVRPEDLVPAIPSGPDAQTYLAAMQRFLEAGVHHLAVVYPGKDTKGFMRFWQKELRPHIS
jgi:G6PDH family F420-dependent oxidoreductase